MPAWPFWRVSGVLFPGLPARFKGRFPVPCPQITLSGPKSRFSLGQVSPGFARAAPLLLIVYLSTAPKVIHNGVCTYVSSKFRHFGVKNRSNGVKIVSKKVKKGAHFVMPILTFWGVTPLGASARAVLACPKGFSGGYFGPKRACAKVIHKKWKR